MEKRCSYMNEEGKRCGAFKISNSLFCFTHSNDVETVKMRESALQKAAESKRLYLPMDSNGMEVSVPLPKSINLSTSKGIRKAYVSIIKASFCGGLDERKVGTLVYALNGYVNAIDKIELMERIERLEKMVLERNQ